MIASKEDLKQYCLRKLGEPVIKVNVAPEQMDEAISDALQEYQYFHHDSMERGYIPYQVQQADIDNKYISLPGNIISVYNVVSAGPNIGHDMEFKYMQDLSSVGRLDGLWSTKQSLKNMKYIVGGGILHEFNIHTNKLTIHIDWENLTPGEDVIFIECWKTIDPDTYTSIYNDKWLKEYSVAVVKKQWGENLKKFRGVQLPGGVELNGSEIYGEAVEELKELKERMLDEYSLPVDFFFG